MAHLRRLGVFVTASLISAGATAVIDASPAAARCRVNQTIVHGQRGDEVLCLERRLLRLHYIDRSIDTFFGTRTVDAVKRFQRNRGLKASGVVGPRTAAALDIGWGRRRPTHHPTARRLLGHSVNGRQINAYRYGNRRGKRVVALGQIHGNEPGGAMIAAFLRVHGAPRGIDLWVVDTVNPDGWRAERRTNARAVDLNRNFNSGNWVRSGKGTGTYSGPSAASEPETRALQRFLRHVQPRLMVVWHQVGRHVDENRSVARYGLLRRYSALTDFPIRSTPSCTRCGGTATSFVNRKFRGATSFTVEMPHDFSYRMARRHALAFLDIAARS